jgi:hypothetical protein
LRHVPIEVGFELFVLIKMYRSMGDNELAGVSYFRQEASASFSESVDHALVNSKRHMCRVAEFSQLIYRIA